MDISLYRDSPEGRLALGSLHANDDGSDPTFLYDATYLFRFGPLMRYRIR